MWAMEHKDDESVTTLAVPGSTALKSHCDQGMEINVWIINLPAEFILK